MRSSILVALALLGGLAPALAQSPQMPAPAGAPKPAAMTPAAAPAKPAAAAPAATAPKAPLVDINTAAKEDLDALPGIGPVRAEAIVKGRPYKGKDDLVRRKVIPQNTYNGIKDRIIAKQS